MSASPQRADWVAVKSAMHQSRQKVRKITCLEQKIVEAVGLQLRCKENLVGQQQRCCCIRVRMLRLIYLHITPSMHHLIGDHPVGRAIYKCSHLHVAQWLNCCLAMHAYSETGPTACMLAPTCRRAARHKRDNPASSLSLPQISSTYSNVCSRGLCSDVASRLLRS